MHITRKELVEEFPFLLSAGAKTCTADAATSNRTHLEDLPEGWVEAFAYQMCKEIKDILIELGELETYEIHKVGEECGILCWQDNNNSCEMRDIIRKYSDIAMDTCIRCPRVAEYDKIVGMSPYCPVCAKKELDEYNKIGEKIHMSSNNSYEYKPKTLKDLFVTHETYENFHY